MLDLLSKITSSREMHEFIFAGGTIGNKFVSKFKMSLWEKMLLNMKTAHFNFTLIRLNNKSSSQFIRLNGTRCRLSKVIVHLWILEGQGKPFFCRSATRTFLRICRVIIYRNVTMLLKPSLSWLASAGTGGMLVTQLNRITSCPRHRPLFGRFYRTLKSCQFWRENTS